MREQDNSARFFRLAHGFQMTVSIALRTAGVALLLLLAALTTSFALGQDSGDAARAISAEIRAKNFQGALDLCRAALEKAPKDTRLLVLEGFAYSGLGKQKEALGAYNDALKISPDFLPALEGAAQIEYNDGNPHAETTLKDLLTLRPDEPTSHAMMAVLLYKKNDCKGAVVHFEKSAPLVETQPAALEQYGICLVQLQRPADAIPIFEQALASNPDDKRARCELAETQMLAEKNADAIATLQPIVEGDTPYPPALDLAAQAQEDLDNTREAVKLLRQAIILDPMNPNYYLDFATLSFNHTSYQVGVDMLNVGLQQLPNSAELYGARGILYIQMAEYDKGERDLETAQRLDPKQTFSADAQGLSELQAHSPEEALAKVRARLKTHPNDAFLHFLLAQILVQSGAALGSPEYAEALREGERALALNPKLTAARDLLGDLYLKAGQIAKSVAESREALKQDPSDQAALYHLVQALRTADTKNEIPGLLKRLAVLREETRKQEAAKNRYKLTEPGQDAANDDSH